MFLLLGAALPAWPGARALHRTPVPGGVRPVVAVPQVLLFGGVPPAFRAQWLARR